LSRQGKSDSPQPTSPLRMQTLSFFDAVDHFSGGVDYETTYMKGKSDYVLNGLSNDGIGALMEALQRIPVQFPRTSSLSKLTHSVQRSRRGDMNRSCGLTRGGGRLGHESTEAFAPAGANRDRLELRCRRP
jgi:hypothetical protein